MLELASLVPRIDRALPFVTLSLEPSERTTWFSDVLERVRLGGDPLAPWRGALARRQGAEDRPHVAAAFVLQWLCEVAARPMAYAAELGPAVLVPSPAGLGLELAPGLYPERVVLRPGAVRVDDVTGDGEPADHTRQRALEASRAAYGLLLEEVVRDFAPDVKMSTRQRWGVVDDVWAMAVRDAAGAAGRSVEPTVERVSCCFIVALPGMRECAGCPRSRRR